MTDFIWQRFIVNPPPNTIKRHINYNENPFLSKTILDIINAAKVENDEKFRHIYLGEPLSNNENAIIKHAWVMASIDAHLELGILPNGSKRVGFDVADSGKDLCCTVSAEGSIVTAIDLWKAKEDELLQSATRAYTTALESGATLFYDCIGVGAGVGAKIKELNVIRGTEVDVVKFLAGGTCRFPEAQYAKSGVKNKDFFSNIKAQAWWSLADRFRNTYNAINGIESFGDEHLISIDSDCQHLEKLIDELTTPLKSYDSCGRVKVESKEEMLTKRGIASPNIADALVMAMLTDHPRKSVPPPVKYQNQHINNWMS